jgi:hypothetical protein
VASSSLSSPRYIIFVLDVDNDADDLFLGSVYLLEVDGKTPGSVHLLDAPGFVLHLLDVDGNTPAPLPTPPLGPTLELRGLGPLTLSIVNRLVNTGLS